MLERFKPALLGPVVVGQSHAVARVADAIHETQRRPGQEAVGRVVLEYTALRATRSASLSKTSGSVVWWSTSTNITAS
jgi:hypothetical protein